MELQVLSLIEEENKEARGMWVIIDDAPALLKEFEGLEPTFMARTSNAKAIKPWTLAKAKHRPN